MSINYFLSKPNARNLWFDRYILPGYKSTGDSFEGTLCKSTLDTIEEGVMKKRKCIATEKRFIYSDCPGFMRRGHNLDYKFECAPRGGGTGTPSASGSFKCFTGSDGPYEE